MQRARKITVDDLRAKGLTIDTQAKRGIRAIPSGRTSVIEDPPVRDFKPPSHMRKKTGAKRSQEEFDNQAALFALLAANYHRHPFLKYINGSMNGAYMTPRQRGRAATQGRIAGVPDIDIPAARHGFGYARIEMKAAKGRLSPEQKETIEYMRSENACVGIAYSCAEAQEFIEWYFGIKLESDR